MAIKYAVFIYKGVLLARFGPYMDAPVIASFDEDNSPLSYTQATSRCKIEGFKVIINSTV